MYLYGIKCYWLSLTGVDIVLLVKGMPSKQKKTLDYGTLSPPPSKGTLGHKKGHFGLKSDPLPPINN